MSNEFEQQLRDYGFKKWNSPNSEKLAYLIVKSFGPMKQTNKVIMPDMPVKITSIIYESTCSQKGPIFSLSTHSRERIDMEMTTTCISTEKKYLSTITEINDFVCQTISNLLNKTDHDTESTKD